MEMQIVLIILIVLAVGIASGILAAYCMDLDREARRRRNRRAKQIKRHAQRMRKITKDFA